MNRNIDIEEDEDEDEDDAQPLSEAERHEAASDAAAARAWRDEPDDAYADHAARMWWGNRLG